MNLILGRFGHAMLDSSDISDSHNFSNGRIAEYIHNIVAGADKQIVWVFNAQRFAVGCMNRVWLERMCLLQFPNFLRDHQSKLASSSMPDKMPRQSVNASLAAGASAKEATL
jgi:hypothetical protein